MERAADRVAVDQAVGQSGAIMGAGAGDGEPLPIAPRHQDRLVTDTSCNRAVSCDSRLFDPQREIGSVRPGRRAHHGSPQVRSNTLMAVLAVRFPD